MVDPHPLYCRRAKGSRIWDVDGNEYIDFSMAFGALVTGHTHPSLVKAIKKQIENGTILGFEGEESFRLAKIICERFGTEMVKFSSTGLEATMHAVRLARAYTGRKKILKFEGCYHGSHDSLLVSVKPTKEKAGDERSPNQVPSSKGVLDSVVQNTVVSPFNDIDATENLVRKNQDEIAGVILEPVPMNMGFVLPRDGFLEGLRKLCDRNKILLIFDEVKTSGKFYRGASGEFGVKPDLVVMGKAIAGGYPLSVLGGRREVMNSIVPGVVAHAGTFNANPVSVMAGIVTLTEILTESSMGRAAKLGDELAGGYTDAIADSRLAARVQSRGLSGTIHFTDGEVSNWRDFLRCDVGRWWTYYISMINRGIVPMATGPDEQWTVSVQHTEEEVQSHLEIFAKVSRMIRETDIEMPMVEAI